MGLEKEGGNNAVVENCLNAPQFGGGRASRRAAAAEVVEKTGDHFSLYATALLVSGARHVRLRYMPG